MTNRFKLISDPVHGFIPVPRGLILDLVQSPEVQRLRRIRQLGVGYLVFPGAEHTRFGHALGAMALMDQALSSVAEKGTPVSSEEHEAALAAALLHDIGHGPFSHTLEREVIAEFHHELMSRALLVGINERLGGKLDEALAIFDNTHPRPFFHQLISGQLDMDRLDYLRRDAFYTGVSEGMVGVQRIIRTLQVNPLAGGPQSELVIESKGVYAVENFIVSRRLMYWQVYLHKTVLSGDNLLKAILRRVRYHLSSSSQIVSDGSPTLLYFLGRTILKEQIEDPEIRRRFCKLDDADVIYSLKRWAESKDLILRDLCTRFLQRDFFRVTFLDSIPESDKTSEWKEALEKWLVCSGLCKPDDARDAASYYLVIGTSRHAAYEQNVPNSIHILKSDGSIHDLSNMPEAAAISALSQPVTKPYVCYPKDAELQI